jgi:cytochrome b
MGEPSVPAPPAVDVLRHCEPRFIGHNPLGGYMMVLLLIIVAMTGASGWLYTTDRPD